MTTFPNRLGHLADFQEVSDLLNIYIDAKSEDDGVLLSIVFDGNKKQSYLLFLDGITLKTIARSNILKTGCQINH